MPQPAPPDGRVLGDFRILREIGRGGMGVVYAAQHVRSGRMVALKVLEAHLTLQRSAVDRFLREGRAAMALRHPHLVRVEQVREDAGAHYFAMELVEGASLAELIAELQVRAAASRLTPPDTAPPIAVASSALPTNRPHAATIADWLQSDRFRRAARLLAGIARALDHAHRRSILHRDVKPSNILIRPDAHALLIDFGLAREEGLPALTHTGDIVGSPYYVAPEQIRAGHAAFDARLDVYSLGVVLYELLTLRRPFEGATQHDVLERIADGAAAPPRSLCPELPAPLEAICLRAMAHAPRDRYESAAALARDLERFAAGRALAIHASPWQRLRFRGGERTPIHVATATIVLGAIAGGLAWWWPPRADGDAAAKSRGHAAPVASARLDLGCNATDATLLAWSGAAADGEPSWRARLPLAEPLALPPGPHALRVMALGHAPREFVGESAPTLAAGETYRQTIWLAPWEKAIEATIVEPPVATLLDDGDRHRDDGERELLLAFASGAITRTSGRAAARPFANLPGELRTLVAIRGRTAGFGAALRTAGRSRVVLLDAAGATVGELPMAGSVTLLRALDLDGDGADELLVGEDVERLTLHRLAPDADAPTVWAVRGAPLEVVPSMPAGAITTALELLTTQGWSEIESLTATTATPRLAGAFRDARLLAWPGTRGVIVDMARGRIVALGDAGRTRFDLDLEDALNDVVALPPAAALPPRLHVTRADGAAEWVALDGVREPAPTRAGAHLVRRLARAGAPPLLLTASAGGIAATALDGALDFELRIGEPIAALDTLDTDGDGNDEILLTTGRRVELLRCARQLRSRAGERVTVIESGPPSPTLLSREASGRLLLLDGPAGTRLLDLPGGATAACVAEGRDTTILWVADGNGAIRGYDAGLQPTVETPLALGTATIERLAFARARDGSRIVAADSDGGLHVLTADGHREGRTTPRAGAALTALEVGDLDGDGDDEIVAAWASAGVIVFDRALHPTRPYTPPGECGDVVLLPSVDGGARSLLVAASDDRHHLLHRLDARGRELATVDVGARVTALVALARPDAPDPPARPNERAAIVELALLGTATGELFVLRSDDTLRALGSVGGEVVALAATERSIAALTATELLVGTLRDRPRRIAAASGAARRLRWFDLDGDGTAELACVGRDGRLEVHAAPAR